MSFQPPDPFDSLLITPCDILALPDTQDESGQRTDPPTLVGTVSARFCAGKGKVKENKSEKKLGIAYHMIYMRPFAGLTIKHTLRIAGKKYDILHIDDPSGLGHHFECTVEEIDD